MYKWLLIINGDYEFYRVLDNINDAKQAVSDFCKSHGVNLYGMTYDIYKLGRVE